MNFFKKILSKKETTVTQPIVVQEDANLEQAFVQHFLHKGGKFLYCTNQEEVIKNFQSIVQENHWETINCISEKLQKILATIPIKINLDIVANHPVFTECERLIVENGSILFSSNQLKDNKIHQLNNNFIVFATTSQLVKNRGESLAGIKAKYKKNLPTNISAIKSYATKNLDDNFMNYGNNNAKNLYLLLLEDL